MILAHALSESSNSFVISQLVREIPKHIQTFFFHFMSYGQFNFMLYGQYLKPKGIMSNVIQFNKRSIYVNMKQSDPLSFLYNFP